MNFRDSVEMLYARMKPSLAQFNNTLLVTPPSPVQGEDRSQTELFERLEKDLELATGIEPATCGLQNRCSTN